MKTKAILGTILGLVATLALSGSPAGAGTESTPDIADPAGDANFVNGQSFITNFPSVSTPVSVESADLRAIWLETTYETVKHKDELGKATKVDYIPKAVQVTFRTEGPIEPPGTGLFFQLPTRIAGCNVIFRAWLAGPAAPITEAAEINKSSAVSGSACPGGTGVIASPQFSFKVTGNTLVLTYPLAALPYSSNQLVLQPDVVIGPTTVAASVRPVIGIVGMNTQIDETYAYGMKFRIAADVPGDLDCLVRPDPATTPQSELARWDAGCAA